MSESIAHLAERRHQRSAEPMTAIKLQLSQVMQDFSLDGCVIATDEGLLVAAAQEMNLAYAEEIAALASHYRDKNQEMVSLATQNQAGQDAQLHIQSFWALGQELLVATVGQAQAMHIPSLLRAALGARRIWDQSSNKLAAISA